jgi:hypothetical protein
VSRSLVVRRLRTLAAQGILPSARFLLPKHGGVVAEILAEFGSIPLARDAAKLDGPPQPTDRDEVLHGLRILHAAGTRIELQTLLRLGEAALVGAARRLFGSLEAALTAAGVPLSTGPMHLRVSRNVLARPDARSGRPRPVPAAPELEALFRRIDAAASAAGAALERSLQTLIPALAGDLVDRAVRGVAAADIAAGPAVRHASAELAADLEVAIGDFARQAADRAVRAVRDDVESALTATSRRQRR